MFNRKKKYSFLEERIEELIIDEVRDAAFKYRGNLTHMAEFLGVSLRTLRNWKNASPEICDAVEYAKSEVA